MFDLVIIFFNKTLINLYGVDYCSKHHAVLNQVSERASISGICQYLSSLKKPSVNSLTCVVSLYLKVGKPEPSFKVY